MGGRINTVMQTCFFALAGVLPRDEAIAKIKDAIKKTYGKRGETVVRAELRRRRRRARHTCIEVAVPDRRRQQRCDAMLPAASPSRRTRLRAARHRDA